VLVEHERLGVAVSDCGVGIAPGDHQLIFERGGRPAGAARRAGGLGLWISRSIAEAHGGTLELRSSLGEGSTFTLWLPRLSDQR
jgi:signal transduction histidine kinase